MIQITSIHEGPYVYYKIFILTQEFPLFVWDSHYNSATLQNDFQ